MYYGINIRDDNVYVSSFIRGTPQILFHMALPAGANRDNVFLDSKYFQTVFSQILSRIRSSSQRSEIEFFLCVSDAYGLRERLEIYNIADHNGISIKNILAETMAIAGYMGYYANTKENEKTAVIISAIDNELSAAIYDIAYGIVEKVQSYVAGEKLGDYCEIPLLNSYEDFLKESPDSIIVVGSEQMNPKANQQIQTLIHQLANASIITPSTLSADSISLGMAIISGLWNKQVDGILWLNTISPYNIYACYNEKYYLAIQAETTIPVKEKQIFSIVNKGHMEKITLYEKRKDEELIRIGVANLQEKDFPSRIGEKMNVFVDVDAFHKVSFIVTNSECAKPNNTSNVTKIPVRPCNFRNNNESKPKELEIEKIIKDFIIIVDTVEYGLRSYNWDTSNPHAQGLEKIYNQAIKSLERLGVTQILADHQPFNPNLHNAIAHTIDIDLPRSTVKEVIQAGYIYKGKVLRYATVIVAN